MKNVLQLVSTIFLFLALFVCWQRNTLQAAQNWSRKFEASAYCNPHSNVKVPSSLKVLIHFISHDGLPTTVQANTSFSDAETEDIMDLQGRFLLQNQGWINLIVPGPKIEGSFYCQDLPETISTEVSIQQTANARIAIVLSPQSSLHLPSIKAQKSTLLLSQKQEKSDYQAGQNTNSPYWFSINYHFQGANEKENPKISYDF